MSQEVEVVLTGIPKGQGVDALSKQFDEFIADLLRTSRIMKNRCQIGRDAEAMVGLAKQQGSSVRGDGFILALDLDSTVKGGCKSFTQFINLRFCVGLVWIPYLTHETEVCSILDHIQGE